MTMERIFEVYGAAFGVYREFSPPAGPVRAADLAQLLRRAGLAAQAYMLVETGIRAAELAFPFIYGDRKGGWRLYLPPGADAYGLPEELLLPDRVLDEEAVIVGEPPVGHRFQLIKDDIQDPKDQVTEIFIFYAATNDRPELAKEQLFADLEEWLARAQQAGKEPVFIDACGLIPEETVKRYATAGNEESAFQKAFNTIRGETENIGKGIAPSDPGSPLWRALWQFLAERRVRSVLEELEYSLWKRIVEFDKQKLMEKAFTEFLTGFPEEAAQTMLQYMREFHKLNCQSRSANLALQIETLVEKAGRPLTILMGREIGHYGVLEGLLSDKYSVHSKILGEERLPLLLKNPVLEASLLGNIGVELSEEDLELMALRHCLKTPLLKAGEGDLRAAAKMLDSCRIDGLSRDQIEELIDELHDPTRIYLRSQGQDILTQLIYLLRDKGIIPEDVLEALQRR